MQNKLISHSLSTLRIIFISSLTIFTLYSVQAWVAPTTTAPNGNVAGPITTSGVDQIKLGSLSVASLLDSNDPTHFFLNPNGDSNLNNIYLKGILNISTGAGAGKVLTSDANGNASWSDQNNSSVTTVSTGLVMDGFTPSFVNSTEDIYDAGVNGVGDFGSGGGRGGAFVLTATIGSNQNSIWPAKTFSDTCDGDPYSQYICKPDESKICDDVFGVTLVTRSFADGYHGSGRRVSCEVSMAYTKTAVTKKVLYFKGNVDDTLDISLTGTNYSESNETLHGDLPNLHKFFGNGVDSAIPLTVTKLDSSYDTISVVQQPNSANGYTAKIQIRDIYHAPGEQSVEFYITK